MSVPFHRALRPLALIGLLAAGACYVPQGDIIYRHPTAFRHRATLASNPLTGMPRLVLPATGGGAVLAIPLGGGGVYLPLFGVGGPVIGVPVSR